MINNIKFVILNTIYNIALKYVNYYEKYTRHTVVVRDRNKAVLLQRSIIMTTNYYNDIPKMEDKLLESVRNYITHNTIIDDKDNIEKHIITITIFNNK